MIVEKKVSPAEKDYMTRGAKEIKAPNEKYISRHSRKCHEMNPAENCKGTVEKDLTPDQQRYYSESFQKERLKNEAKIRRQKKKEIK